MNILYFCHIPKTAGYYVEETLFSALNETCKNNGLDTSVVLKYGHFGWKPVNEDTYIFTISRNPINRTVSHFVYYNPEITTLSIEEAKKHMLEFVENNSFMHNYQTKYLCSMTVENHSNDIFMDNGTNGYKEKFDRVNKIVKSENINPEKLKDLYYYFCMTRGLGDPILNVRFPEYRIIENISGAARAIRDSLTMSEVKYLESINEKDFEFYERGD